MLNATYEPPVVLSNGVTAGLQMKFTMLLDDGEEKIDTSAKVGRFIYAVGSDHFLTFHSAFGSAELSLEACQVLKEGEEQEGPTDDRFEQLWGYSSCIPFMRVLENMN